MYVQIHPETTPPFKTHFAAEQPSYSIPKWRLPDFTAAERLPHSIFRSRLRNPLLSGSRVSRSRSSLRVHQHWPPFCVGIHEFGRKQNSRFLDNVSSWAVVFCSYKVFQSVFPSHGTQVWPIPMPFFMALRFDDSFQSRFCSVFCASRQTTFQTTTTPNSISRNFRPQ